MKTVFGYGSLILPTASAGKLQDVSPVDKVYSRDSDKLVRSDALKKWRELKDQVDFVPVKVQGLKRYYSNESPRGGAMLEVFPDEGSWVNGVIIFDLPDGIYSKVAETERKMGGYTMEEIPGERIETYIEPGRKIPEKIRIFVPDEESKHSRLDTSRSRNQVYHRRIMKGIEMLGEEYGEDVEESFRTDFMDTTYEKVNGGWRKLSELDKKIQEQG